MKRKTVCGVNFVHQYSEECCPVCGQVFCWACCGKTNVHEGGKYAPSFMECPRCGYDILGEPFRTVIVPLMEQCEGMVCVAESDAEAIYMFPWEAEGYNQPELERLIQAKHGKRFTVWALA